MNHVGEWDWQFLSLFLPNHVRDLLATLPTPFEGAGPDLLIWLRSQDGDFNVNLAQSGIVGYHSSNSYHFFKLIWKWRGLERIKLFFDWWLMMCFTLMTSTF